MAKKRSKRSVRNAPSAEARGDAVLAVLHEHDGHILNTEVIREVRRRIGAVVSSQLVTEVRRANKFPIPKRGGVGIKSRYNGTPAAPQSNVPDAAQAMIEYGFANNLKEAHFTFDAATRTAKLTVRRVRVEEVSEDIEVRAK